MQLSNDYEVGVFNGDVGLVDDVMRNGSFVGRFVTGIDKQTRVMYSSKDVGDTVSLAYALTVHKAQGAEYPVVVVPLLSSHYTMLYRNLVYTGISRAKRLLVVVGERSALTRAVTNGARARRFTLLAERVDDRSFAPAVTRHMSDD